MGAVERKVSQVLGVKNYEKSYIDQCRTATAARVAAYDKLGEPGDFEAVFLNTMVLALDRLFVHRLRGVEGKDGNPLNEVRVLADSIAENNGVMAADSQIKFKNGTITGLDVGDTIALSEIAFRELADGFFAEIAARFG
jgi:hypothetical protein